MRARNVMVKVLMCCVGVIGGLLVLEMVLNVCDLPKTLLHWVLPIKVDSFYRLDKNRIYAIREDEEVDYGELYKQADQKGMRFNRDHLGRKEVDYEIIMVGDSYTYGHRMANKSYPAMVEEKLLEDNKDVIVRNAGVSGYGLDQEYVYIQELIEEEPDMIVWNLNMNDVGDSNRVCLFKKGIRGWKKIASPWLNSLYWEGRIMSSAPRVMRNWRTVKLVATLPKIVTGMDRYTLGCTKKDMSREDIQLISEKLRFFLNQIKYELDERD